MTENKDAFITAEERSRMGAKDTVMSRERIEGTIGYFMESPKILDGIVEVAEQQAEISFKAGIKEVVEWIKQQNLMVSTVKSLLESSLWQAKLKEWGCL